jgi:hypothetical protein
VGAGGVGGAALGIAEVMGAAREVAELGGAHGRRGRAPEPWVVRLWS